MLLDLYTLVLFQMGYAVFLKIFFSIIYKAEQNLIQVSTQETINSPSMQSFKQTQ